MRISQDVMAGTTALDVAKQVAAMAKESSQKPPMAVTSETRQHAHDLIAQRDAAVRRGSDHVHGDSNVGKLINTYA